MSKVSSKKESEYPSEDEKTLPVDPDHPEFGELKTEVGLKFMNWGLLIYMVSTLVTLGFGLSGSTALSTTLVAFVCGLVFLSFLAFVLFLMGFYNTFVGRFEIGTRHEGFATFGLVLFIIYILVVAASIAVPMVYAFNDPDAALKVNEIISGDDGGDEDGDDPELNETEERDLINRTRVYFQKSTSTQSIMNVISTSMLTLALMVIHYESSDAKMRLLSYLSVLTIVLSTLFGSIIAIYVTSDVDDELRSNVEISDSIKNSTLIDMTVAATLLGFLLLTFCCYMAYRRIKTREYFKEKRISD